MEPAAKRRKTNWTVPLSTIGENTFNPIRSIVDTMKITPHPDKPMIALSIGKIRSCCLIYFIFDGTVCL